MLSWKPIALAASLMTMPALSYAGECGCEKCACEHCDADHCEGDKGDCSCTDCKEHCPCHGKEKK